MDFRESDLKKLPFEVIGDIRYLEKYPSLLDIPEFKEEIVCNLPVDFDSLFKYFVLLYSPGTPLLNIKDFPQRKQTALEISGMLRDPDMFQFDKETNLAYMLMMAYLKMMNNNKWAKLSVYQSSYYNLMLRLQSGKTEAGERTKNLIENIDSLQVKIDELITDLANGDYSPKVTTNVLQSIEDVKNELLPETIARKILNGEDPTRNWSPYVTA